MPGTILGISYDKTKSLPSWRNSQKISKYTVSQIQMNCYRENILKENANNGIGGKRGRETAIL